MSNQENNPFLGRGMATSGSYDMPDYSVAGAVVRKLFPGSGTRSKRRTMDLFEEGRTAVPPQENVGLEDKILKATDGGQIPDGGGPAPDVVPPDVPGEAPVAAVSEATPEGAPMSPEGGPAPEAPANEPVGITRDEQALEPVKAADVEEIEAQRGEELRRRTRERNINLDYLENAEDIGALLEANAKNMRFGDEAPKSLDQTRANVEGRHSEIWNRMMAEKPDALSDEQMLAGRDMLVTMAAETDALARKIAGDPGKATDEMKLEFDRLSDSTAMIQQYMSGKIRTAARALNSMKAVSQTIRSNDPRKMMNDAGGMAVIERARAVVDASDRARGVQALDADGNVIPGSAGDPLAIVPTVTETSALKGATQAIVNYRAAAMLTGPKTHGVNLFNNAFMGGLRTLAVRPTAAAIGAIRTGNVPGADRVEMAEVGAEIAGTLQSVMDGLNVAWNTWYQGTFVNKGEFISPYGGRKIDEIAEDTPLIGSSTVGKIPGAKYTGIPQTLDKAQRGIESISFGLLTASDDFFKTMHYRKSLYGQAARQASKEGLYGKAGAKRANELLDNITHKMHSEAMQQAEEQTFTNREDVTWLLDSIASGLSTANQKVPLLKTWFPFLRTPTAIFDRTVKMSVLAPVQEAYKRRLDKGGVEADMARAEIVVGTAMTTMIAGLASMGLMTGNGPSRSQDPSGVQRKGLEATGWQRNSIRVGDTYVSLQRGFDPVMLAGLGIAQMVEASQYAKNEPEALDYLTGATLLAAATFVDNTYMSGVKDLMELALGRQSGTRATADFAGTMVPALSRDANAVWRMLNDEEGYPTRYKTDNLSVAVMMELQAKIPGMDSGPVARYWDGSVKTSGGGDMMSLYNTMSPIRSSYIYNSEGRDADPATREIVDNGVNISQPSPELTLSDSGFSINLVDDVPNGTELYEMLIQDVGAQRRRAVESVINSSAYQEYVDNGWTGPKSFAAIEISKAISKGLKNGQELFLSKIRDPDFDLERYGPEATGLIRGEALEELLELNADEALLPEEKKLLIRGGVKGVAGRKGLAPPEGSGSSRTKEYIPDI